MKNKRSCNIKYILTKNIRSSENSIIHRWMSNCARWITLLIAVSIVLSMLGCVEKPEQKEGTPVESVESFFESVNMSIDPEPILNQPVEITVTASSPSVNVSNVTLEILLPDGFELISGNLKWEGDIQMDEIKNLNAEIKSVKTGNWVIQFLATANLPRGVTYLETDFLYISVYETEAKVSDTPSIGIIYNSSAQMSSQKTTTEKIK